MADIKSAAKTAPTIDKNPPEPTLSDALVANAPDKIADAKEAGLVIGKKTILTAVHGRMIHPNQVPLEFNPGEMTPVKVDQWVIAQFEAGKLKMADLDAE